jgi:hypothetical protein
MNLSEEDGVLGITLMALCLSAGVLALFHGNWQRAFDAIWYSWKKLFRHMDRVEKQTLCAICGGPSRYIVLEDFELPKTRPIKEARISCDCCKETALFHIDVVNEFGARVESPGVRNVCRKHHPNVEIGDLAHETHEKLKGEKVHPEWIRMILYPSHEKPVRDEAREHYFCADHHVISGVGAKSDETRDYLAKRGVVWGTTYPFYNARAMFSMRTRVKKDSNTSV